MPPTALFACLLVYIRGSCNWNSPASLPAFGPANTSSLFSSTFPSPCRRSVGPCSGFGGLHAIPTHHAPTNIVMDPHMLTHRAAGWHGWPCWLAWAWVPANALSLARWLAQLRRTQGQIVREIESIRHTHTNSQQRGSLPTGRPPQLGTTTLHYTTTCGPSTLPCIRSDIYADGHAKSPMMSFR